MNDVERLEEKIERLVFFGKQNGGLDSVEQSQLRKWGYEYFMITGKHYVVQEQRKQCVWKESASADVSNQISSGDCNLSDNPFYQAGCLSCDGYGDCQKRVQ